MRAARALVLLTTLCAELTFTAVAVPVTWLLLPLLMVMYGAGVLLLRDAVVSLVYPAMMISWVLGSSWLAPVGTAGVADGALVVPVRLGLAAERDRWIHVKRRIVDTDASHVRCRPGD